MTTCNCERCIDAVSTFERQTDKTNKIIPSVGRVVHYVVDESTKIEVPSRYEFGQYETVGFIPSTAHRAATITYVENESEHIVGLCVMNPNSIEFVHHVQYDSTAARPGTWHWPERV